jgi:hypothetical protein
LFVFNPTLKQFGAPLLEFGNLHNAAHSLLLPEPNPKLIELLNTHPESLPLKAVNDPSYMNVDTSASFGDPAEASHHQEQARRLRQKDGKKRHSTPA